MADTELAEMIDRQTVEELTSKFAEPQWLADRRLQSWEAYLQSPMPGLKDERWRRMDLSILDLTRLRAFDLAVAKKMEEPPVLPGWYQRALEKTGKYSGLLLQTTKNGGYLHASPKLAEAGVVFCDIATAIEKHAELIRPHLLSASKGDHSKFEIMAGALFNCGAFLHVPANVHLDAPVFYGLGLSAHAGNSEYGVAIFPRLFVLAESGSSVDFVFLLGDEGESEKKRLHKHVSLASALVDVQVGAGAQVNFLSVQDLRQDVFYVEALNSHVANEGQYNSLTLAVGGRQTKSDIATYLEAPGAHSNVLGVVLGDADEHFNYNTIQEHNAPDTTSNINFRVALKDRASSSYQGIVRVDKIAQRTDAYQSNKNLILGGDAKADSIPKLEILANDVKCSHGATVGPVDKEQVFYLQSRGLTPDEAEELIVLGFFHQVLEQFPLSSILSWLNEVVSAKVLKSGN